MVVQAQVVELVVEAVGAKLLANDIVGQTRVRNESFHSTGSSGWETLPLTIVGKTRLPERDYGEQQDPQQHSGEGWPQQPHYSEASENVHHTSFS